MLNAFDKTNFNALIPNLDAGQKADPEKLQNYLTDVEVYLESIRNALVSTASGDSGADLLKATALNAQSGTSVQAILAYLLAQIQGVTQGAVADGSITTANLADLVIVATKIAAGAVTEDKLNSKYFAATGLTGAVQPSRYVGGTTSGAPTTGTFAVGDFVIDQMGLVWICITAGTPGAWKKAALTIPELYIPLWNYDGGVTSTTQANSAVAFVVKGSISMPGTLLTEAYLHRLNNAWPVSTQFAFDVSFFSSAVGTAVYAMLRDLTAGVNVTGSQVMTTAGVVSTVRSGKFTLTPGNQYGITLWAAGGATVRMSSASLIAFPA